MEPLTLEERLAAAQKTIAALTRRVEGKMACGSSAFAVLEQNIALERVVGEKTRQLVAKREELQQALSNLKAAQAELLHSSKLESVGRLASGIAHEINTPIQFVSDSVHFLREGFEALVPLVRRYRELREAAAAGQVSPALLADLERVEEEADLDYLLEHGPRAFERALEGLGRVTTLVRSMKEFAHPGERQKAPADLNRAISATLDIDISKLLWLRDFLVDEGLIDADFEPGTMTDRSIREQALARLKGR